MIACWTWKQNAVSQLAKNELQHVRTGEFYLEIKETLDLFRSDFSWRETIHITWRALNHSTSLGTKPNYTSAICLIKLCHFSLWLKSYALLRTKPDFSPQNPRKSFCLRGHLISPSSVYPRSPQQQKGKHAGTNTRNHFMIIVHCLNFMDERWPKIRWSRSPTDTMYS